LAAHFTHQFPEGFQVEAAWERPLDRFSLTVLFGPSGCGKTTTLRCLAGLERPHTGFLRCGDKVWFDAAQGICLTPQQRDIGLLFQDYALFPHLTVAQNIAYGLGDLPWQERRQRVAEMLDLFQLHGLERRYPRQVSGGQQQRIALARVLVRRPRLLLLDEPLSALDAPTREQLRPELRRRLRESGLPVILVTHDRLEAMALADHLLVMDQGKVRQQGTVAEVFSRPADLAVARIVGTETVLPGKILHTVEGLATVALGAVQLLALAPPFAVEEVYVCIRGEEVALQHGPGDSGSPRNRLEGIVGGLHPEGAMVRVQLDCGFPLTALITRPACEELHLAEGSRVTALLKVPAVHLIPRG
jgi:molybdate transport system ATP-binding protein